jgi:hypothetical protein
MANRWEWGNHVRVCLKPGFWVGGIDSTLPVFAPYRAPSVRLLRPSHDMGSLDSQNCAFPALRHSPCLARLELYDLRTCALLGLREFHCREHGRFVFVSFSCVRSRVFGVGWTNAKIVPGEIGGQSREQPEEMRLARTRSMRSGLHRTEAMSLLYERSSHPFPRG